jgi:hypothetical protein
MPIDAACTMKHEFFFKVALISVLTRKKNEVSPMVIFGLVDESETFSTIFVT